MDEFMIFLVKLAVGYLIIRLLAALLKLSFYQISNTIFVEKLREKIIPKIVGFFDRIFFKIDIFFEDIYFGITDRIDEWKWERSEEKRLADEKIAALEEEARKNRSTQN